MDTYGYVAVTALLISIVLSTILNVTSAICAAISRSHVIFIRLLLTSLFICNLFQALLGYPIRVYVFLKESAATTMECSLEAYAVYSMASVSIAHITVLCLHLLVQFQKPYLAQKINKSRLTAALTTIALWVFGLVIASPPFFGWSQFTQNNSKRHFCGLDFNLKTTKAMLYVGFSMIILYVLPLFLLIRAPFLLNRGDFKSRNTLVQLHSRLTKVTMAMLASFLVMWTPYAIVGVLMFCSVNVSPTVIFVCNIIAKISTIPNSIVYFVAYNLRINNSIRHWFRRRSSGPHSATVETQVSEKQYNHRHKELISM